MKGGGSGEPHEGTPCPQLLQCLINPLGQPWQVKVLGRVGREGRGEGESNANHKWQTALTPTP